jgi:hypothetical protein
MLGETVALPAGATEGNVPFHNAHGKLFGAAALAAVTAPEAEAAPVAASA